jgi:hypothetical protein
MDRPRGFSDGTCSAAFYTSTRSPRDRRISTPHSRTRPQNGNVFYISARIERFKRSTCASAGSPTKPRPRRA